MFCVLSRYYVRFFLFLFYMREEKTSLSYESFMDYFILFWTSMYQGGNSLESYFLLNFSARRFAFDVIILRTSYFLYKEITNWLQLTVISRCHEPVSICNFFFFSLHSVTLKSLLMNSSAQLNGFSIHERREVYLSGGIYSWILNNVWWHN